jgi:hypothetical protein
VRHAIVRRGFERVRNGVPEVQDGAATCIALVGNDHAPLQDQTTSDDLRDGPLVAPHEARNARFESPEEGGIQRHGGLRDLGKSLAVITGRKRAQSAHISPQRDRLVKGSDEVLRTGKVDGGFASERGVHHRKETRGEHNERNTAMPGRGQESGQGSGHAAAEGYDDRLLPRAPLQEPILEQRLGVARFETFTGRKRQEYGLDALGRKPPDELPAVETSHASVRNDDLQTARERAREIRRGEFERARGDDDGRRPRRRRPRRDAEANRPLAGWDQFGGVFEPEPNRSSSAR